MTKTLVVVSLVSLLALGVAIPALAQNQINLNDGIDGVHFNGAGNPMVSMLIPAPYCSGGTCYVANGTASATGDLAGNGTYTVTSPATTPGVGGFVGPFSLTVQPDGSSVVNQTEQMVFTYTSTEGTLTGNLSFTTVSATNSHLQSTMVGTLIVTGGSFAPYFPNGANVNITWYLTFPLQTLWQIHGFSTAEFGVGTIIPAQPGSCQPLSQRLRRYENGLPRVAAYTPSDLIASFTQTNNPSQIPCTASDPCGSMDVALGSGGYSGDLMVTVQLGGPGQDFQADRLGFNSDIGSGFALDCFNFGNGCSSGVGGATLGGAKQEDGFGTFQHTLYTGLNGGSGCAPDGTGCKNLFTFVVGNSNGPLQVSDFNAYVAAHIANGSCSGYIATPSN